MNIGDRVRLSKRLQNTDRNYGLTPLMQQMGGRIKKIKRINGDMIFFENDEFIWSIQDVIPIKNPKDIRKRIDEPQLFNPEYLNMDDLCLD